MAAWRKGCTAKCFALFTPLQNPLQNPLWFDSVEPYCRSSVEALSNPVRQFRFDRSVELSNRFDRLSKGSTDLSNPPRVSPPHTHAPGEIVRDRALRRDRARSCAAARSCEIVRSGDDGGGGAGGVGVELELRCCCARAAAAASPSGSERESTKRSNVARFVPRGARAGRRMGGRDGHARWARGGGAAVRVELDAPSIRARAAASPSGE